jgi:hypothetical protein
MKFREKRNKGGSWQGQQQTASGAPMSSDVRRPDGDSRQRMMRQNGHSEQKQGTEQQKEQMRPGFIWIKQGEQLVPYRVKTGMTDGSYTQIEGDIPEGAEVVTGIIGTQSGQNTQQQQSPFAPQRMPGRGGR